MKITFMGGTQEVTGSRYLLENKGIKLLVDCGLFQGPKELRKRNYDPFSVDPSSITAIVLTHAHIDHTGFIPAVVKNGFKGRIYCSRPTFELCKIMLIDAAKIQEEDANKKGSDVEPAYTVADAEYSLKLFAPVDYDAALNIDDAFQVTLIQSFHILGAAFVRVSDGNEMLTFSGDLGRPEQLIMKAPPAVKQTDFLVLESTYGNRLHKEIDPVASLGQMVKKTIDQGGVVIIPAFAVGRTQTIIYSLFKLKQEGIIPADTPIFLDSPMAISVTQLYCRYEDEHKLPKNNCSAVFDQVIYTRTVKQSKKLDHFDKPAIIIAGSGMADGGRVADHFQHYISDPKNTVIFTGYQAHGTQGRALIEGAEDIDIRGKRYPVRATITKLNALSAHADYKEILDWLSHFTQAPKTTFLTHGEIDSAKALKEKIEDRFGWKVVIPEFMQSFDLE